MKSAHSFLTGFLEGTLRSADRQPGFGHRFLPGMLAVFFILFCPWSAFAASLSVYDQVRFADPGTWVATYGYGSTEWQAMDAYDTDMQSYTNAFDGSASIGQASSWAQYGSLGSYVTTTTAGVNAYSSVSSGALWSDTWSITGPGLTGVGTLTLSYKVEGSMSDPAGSYVRGWAFEMTGYGPGNGGYWWEKKVNDGNTANWDDGGPYSDEFSIPFTFGAANSITVSLQTATDANGYADFIATLGGLKVFDSSGNPTGVYTFTADSGHRYFPSPVPVPGALWLLGSGLVGLFGIRKRMANR